MKRMIAFDIETGGLEQNQKDLTAYSLLIEVIQLGRSGLPYKKRLKALKKALHESPAAMGIAQSITKDVKNESKNSTRSKRRQTPSY